MSKTIVTRGEVTYAFQWTAPTLVTVLAHGNAEIERWREHVKNPERARAVMAVWKLTGLGAPVVQLCLAWDEEERLRSDVTVALGA